MDLHVHSHNPARSLAAAGIFLAMLVTALSLWTAIPLSWLYIGSKVSQSQFPSQGPYMVVAIGILLSIVFVAWLLGRLNSLYIHLTGTNRLAPMRPNWLRSMRDSGPEKGSTTVVEAVLMSSVILAAIALTAWFFLLAGSPIPNQ